MEADELQRVWQSQDRGRQITVDADLVLNLVRQNDTGQPDAGQADGSAPPGAIAAGPSDSGMGVRGKAVRRLSRAAHPPRAAAPATSRPAKRDAPAARQRSRPSSSSPVSPGNAPWPVVAGPRTSPSCPARQDVRCGRASRDRAARHS